MTRQLHFGLHPYGVGGPGSDGLWKDPRVAKTASVDIDYYIDWAKPAERGLFDAFFIVGTLGLPFPVNRHTYERPLVTV